MRTATVSVRVAAALLSAGLAAALAPSGAALARGDDRPHELGESVQVRPSDARTGPPVSLPSNPHGLPAQAHWGSAVEGFASYQPQSACAGKAMPGTLALRDLVLKTYGPGSDGGTVRTCSVGGQSEHKDGRAWDWMVDVDKPAERRAAADFIAWLLKPRDGVQAAMARRLGVMYVIYNRKIWAAYSPGWRAYDYGDPHTSHVHVSLSWNGARGTTSFWRGKVLPVDPGTCSFFAGSPAVVPTSKPRTTACPQPAASPRGSSRPTSWLGNSGDSVSRARSLLGLKAGSAFDKPLRQKVMAYQVSHDLPRTGALDKPTWASLDRAARTWSVPQWTKDQAVAWARQHGTPALHRSSAGTAVYALQVALGMPLELRTGFYGTRTDAQVQAFRAAHGMPRAGQVTDEVWDALGA